MKKFFLTVSLCCAALMLNGKTYYVSVSGSDKNPGSAQAPFATIAFAASKAAAGDTVKIGPGIYREQIVFTRSGKKDAPSLLKVPGEKTVLF